MNRKYRPGPNRYIVTGPEGVRRRVFTIEEVVRGVSRETMFFRYERNRARALAAFEEAKDG